MNSKLFQFISRVPAIFFILLFYVFWRLLYLYFIHPDYYFGTHEDLYRGAVAKLILDGAEVPLLEYRADNYSGGSVVVGIITVLFFSVFGPNAFALKLTPLLFFTLSLALWYQCIQFFDKRAAIFFALLFTFSPLVFTHYSLTTMGFHSESIFFTTKIDSWKQNTLFSFTGFWVLLWGLACGSLISMVLQFCPCYYIGYQMINVFLQKRGLYSFQHYFLSDFHPFSNGTNPNP